MEKCQILHQTAIGGSVHGVMIMVMMMMVVVMPSCNPSAYICDPVPAYARVSFVQWYVPLDIFSKSHHTCMHPPCMDCVYVYQRPSCLCLFSQSLACIHSRVSASSPRHRKIRNIFLRPIAPIVLLSAPTYSTLLGNQSFAAITQLMET